MFSGTGSYPLENLSKENRWGNLADTLDWKHIEEEYSKRLSNQSCGACNKPVRMVIGAMIIKHTLCCSNEGTILSIVCHCPPLGRPKKSPDPEEEKLRREVSGACNGEEARSVLPSASTGQRI